MAEETTHLPFLVASDFHLSSQKANEAVIATLIRCGERKPKEGWEKAVVTWKEGNPPKSMSFFDMVREARRTGIISDIQRYLDRQDAIFGGKTSDSRGTPNFNLNLATDYAGFRAEAQGPCRIAFVEKDLTEDILYFRRQACLHSNSYDFVLTSRYYRNYLAACLSIVDAFVNRHILIAKAIGMISPEFTELENAINVEEKMELWWKACCGTDPRPLFSSSHWCRFQELRKRRNCMLHALEPIAVYALPEMQVYLNKVRSGIGELLLLMRKASKQPTLGFIEQLRTAPLIAYHKIRLKATGDICESVTNGKD